MNIAVLSRNSNLYSTKRLVEAARQRGHECRVLDHLRCDIIIEQNNPAIHYRGDLIKNLDAVIPRIGASVTFYGSAVVRQFEMMNVFTTTKSQAIVRSRDKLRSMQILARSGVGLPKTAFTNYSREDKYLIEAVGGTPCVIKLLEGTQGLGVVLAETRKAAQSVIEAFHNLKARVIVQEFIKEAKASDIRAFIIGNEVVSAMKRQGKEGEFRSNLHRGGSATIYKLNRAEKAAALTAAKAMGLTIAGVDMLQSNRGPLILEVNSSPGLEGIEEATGIDIASKVIKYIEQERTNVQPRRKKPNPHTDA
jgi:ribosomal protein S6--L-glutamate ligase